MKICPQVVRALEDWGTKKVVQKRIDLENSRMGMNTSMGVRFDNQKKINLITAPSPAEGDNRETQATPQPDG